MANGEPGRINTRNNGTRVEKSLTQIYSQANGMIDSISSQIRNLTTAPYQTGSYEERESRLAQIEALERRRERVRSIRDRYSDNIFRTRSFDRGLERTYNMEAGSPQYRDIINRLFNRRYRRSTYTR